MSEELRQPAVVDLDALLQPIPGDNPSGEYLRYSGLYDEVGEARRQDENLSQGAWQTELKQADFRRVIDLITPAITGQSKDLQLAIWLTEALIKQHGFVGLRDGIKLLYGLQENFWDTLHPEVEEGDMEGRANAVAWLDDQGAFAIKGSAFTGGLGYSFRDLEDSKRFDFPDSIDGLPGEERARFQELKDLAESGHRVTAEMWRKEVADTRRSPMERVNFTIEECLTAFEDLNRVVEEKFDRNQTPGLTSFKKSLVEIHDEVKKLLELKRSEEPDAIYEEAGEGGEASGGDGTGAAGKGGATGAIQSRKDALKRLAEIADYFQHTEPHSPVSYLVQRAVKWGNMPLETWLQDVIKDDTIMSSLRQTLGFNTGGEPPGA